jgi:hypothetical protein
MTKQELVAIAEASWRRLDTTVAGLDEAAMTEPGVVGAWSIKDILGHVTAWDQMVVQHLECWRRGEEPPRRDWASADDYNAREAAKRQGWPLAQILDEAADIRGRLLTLLDGVTDEEWVALMTLNGEQRPLGEWVGGALSGDEGPGTHAAEHAAQIHAWREARER